MPNRPIDHQLVFVRISVVLVCLGGSCSPGPKLSYDIDELRQELKLRVKDIPQTELIVPFEVSEEHIKRARSVAGYPVTPSERVRALNLALFDRGQFGLRYVPGTTKTAEETLASKEGNCVSIASVFIGLARAIGLRAYYLEASHRVNEVRFADDLIVRTGHITAVAKTELGLAAMDFGYQLKYFLTFRVIDDLEATAHFYNNRGYEIIAEAQAKGKPADWAVAQRYFQGAARLMPSFIRAWNNLGVAFTKLGRYADAEASYRRALIYAPRFTSPQTNLGMLYLQQGKIDEAISALSLAVQYDPKTPHVHYHLGIAYVRKGDIPKAIAALQRAVKLQKNYRDAKVLLDSLMRQAQDSTERAALNQPP